MSSGLLVDTNSFYDTEVTSLNKLVVDTLVFEKRDGTQLDMLTVLTNEISGTTVSTFNLNDYVISSAVMNTQLTDSNLFDTTEDMQIDTMVVNGSTDSTIDHKLGVSGFSLFSEDGSGFFNATTASSTSGVVDSSGGLRGVVNVSREIYLKDGNGDYIQLGLAVYALIGLLPMTEYVSGGNVIRKSLHSFNFSMESNNVDIPVTIALEDYVPDFIIENITNDASGTFQFNFNDFAIDIGVDSSGSFVKSLGAFSVVFDVNTDTLIKVTPVSPRAKEYQDTWCEETSHNIHTLFKGLFGQMLVNSGIVPVEVTQNSSGTRGEAFTGYITDDSLERNVVPKFDGWISNTDGSGSSSFFEQEHDQIITNLQTSFRDIWMNDNNAEWYANLYNSTTSGPIFTPGDTFSVPMEISMRYKIQSDDNEPNYTAGLNGNTNLDGMAASITNIVTSTSAEAEETWRFIYKFNVQDASGSVTATSTGGANSGPLENWNVEFKSLLTGESIYDGAEISTDSNGLFTLPDTLKNSFSLYEIILSCVDSSGRDALTGESSEIGDFRNTFGDALTGDVFHGNMITSLLLEQVKDYVASGNTLTREWVYEQKTSLESSFGVTDIGINPYDTDTDSTAAASISSLILQVEALLNSIKTLLESNTSKSSSELASEMRKAIVSKILQQSGSIDLSDPTFVEGVIETAATSIVDNGVDIETLKANSTGIASSAGALQTAFADTSKSLETLLLDGHKTAKSIKEVLNDNGDLTVDISSAVTNKIAVLDSNGTFGSFAVALYTEPEPESSSLIVHYVPPNTTFDGSTYYDLDGVYDLTSVLLKQPRTLEVIMSFPIGGSSKTHSAFAGFGLDFDGGEAFYLGSVLGKIQFWSSNRDVNTSIQLDNGTRYRIAVTYDGYNLDILCDNLDNSDPIDISGPHALDLTTSDGYDSPGPTIRHHGLVVGARYMRSSIPTSTYMDGTIEYVKIYNKAISSFEDLN